MNLLLRYIRTPLPYRSRRRSMVQVLLIINIVVFIGTQLFPVSINFLAIQPFLFLRNFFVWTPITYMFIHADFGHILFNMLGLYFFGTIIERQWGSDEFLVLYLSTGILSGILSLLVFYATGTMNVFLLGASGAIYGVLLVFATLYPNAQLYVFGLFPVRAKILIVIYIGMQLLLLTGQGSRSNVAYLTHLFGIAVAWVYLLVRHRIDPYRKIFSR